MIEVRVTEVHKTFIDESNYCGHGEGTEFSVTLRFDCYDGEAKAVVKEVWFRKIADSDGVAIYTSLGFNGPHVLEASEWKVFSDFVNAKITEHWNELQPIALASEPVESYFDEEDFYDVF